MARTWTLFVLLICALAVGRSSGTNPAPTRTVVPTPTVPPSTGPVPTPTVLPPPKDTYIIKDDNDKRRTCLILVATMNVTFMYKNVTNPNQTVTFVEQIDRHKPNTDSSSCNNDAANVVLWWDPGYGFEADPRILTLKFSASHKKGYQHWTFDSVNFEVAFAEPDFPDYNTSISTENLRYNVAPFFDETIEFERGYQCDAPHNYTLKRLTEHQIDVTLTVKDFHVQAFRFKDPGVFGNARRCLADSGDGNKMVPIGVGVALAVLVIVVFIAFIISKLVNRRKTSSYETLN